MYTLIILFESPESEQTFQSNWQTFLGLAEKMPGLRGETVSRVGRILFGEGDSAPALIHELLFDSKEALEAAMQSPEGEAAGAFLQSFTGGKMMLLEAEHLEAGENDFSQRKT